MIFRSNFFRHLSESEPTGSTKRGKGGRAGRTRQRLSRRADFRRLLERDLRFESLEARRVLAVAAMLDGDDNAVLTGSAAADTITLTVDSGRLVVIDTGGATAGAGFTQDDANTISIDVAAILGGNLFVNTGGGNDSIEITNFAAALSIHVGGPDAYSLNVTNTTIEGAVAGGLRASNFGSATITDSLFLNNGGVGVELVNGGTVSFDDAVVNLNIGDGIRLDDVSDVTLTDIWAQLNGGAGLDAFSVGEVELDNSLFAFNFGDGIRLHDTGAIAISFVGGVGNGGDGLNVLNGDFGITLASVGFNSNDGDGISITDSGDVTFDDEFFWTAENNEGNGLIFSNVGAVELGNAVIANNWLDGVRIADATSVSVISFFDVLASGEHGVYLTGIGSVVFDDLFLNSGFGDALRIEDSGTVTIRNSTVGFSPVSNDGSGIRLKDIDNVVIDNVLVRGNQVVGLSIESVGTLTITELELTGNVSAGSISDVAELNFTGSNGNVSDAFVIGSSLQHTLDPLGVNLVNQAIDLVDVSEVNLFGGEGEDTFRVVQAGLPATGTLNLFGGDPTTLPGDRLIYDGNGVNTVLGPDSGTITAAGFRDVEYSGMEQVEAGAGFELESVIDLTLIPGGEDGEPNQLTARLDATGTLLLLFFDPDGPGPAPEILLLSQPLANVDQLTLQGTDDDDTLTVDFANGSPVPSGGIAFDGGNGFDALEVINYFGVDTLTVDHFFSPVGGPFSGSVQVGSMAPLITFADIEPLALAGDAADVVINLPAGVNPDVLIADDTAINFPGNGLDLANTSAIGGSTFEYTSFTNPTNSLTVNGNISADTITLRAMDAAYAADTRINTGAGDDTVVILATTAGTLTAIDTQIGFPETVLIGVTPGNENTGAGSLSDIAGDVTLSDSGGAGQFVIIDNSSDTADRDWTVSSSGPNSATVAISGITGTITYDTDAHEQVSLIGGDGDDQFTIDLSGGNIDDPLPFTNLNLFGGGQGAGGDSLVLIDNVNVHATVTHLFANANDGEVIFNAQTPNNDRIRYFGLEPILDNLNVTNRMFTFLTPGIGGTLEQSPGGLGATHTRIDSAASELVDFTTPTNSLVINLATGVANTFAVNSLSGDFNTPTNTINLGANGDTVNFERSNAGANGWTVVGGAGNDTVNLSPVAQNLDFLSGRVTFNGGGGVSDTLNVFDDNNIFNDTFTVTSTTIDRFFWDGGATYDAAVEFVNLVTTGLGNNTINVNSTSATATTTIDANSGNDTFNILASALGGTNIFRGGTGNDTFNLSVGAAGITAPVSISGGANNAGGGRDTVRISDIGFGASVATPITFTYTGAAGGTGLTFAGIGSTVTIDTVETVAWVGGGGNDDVVTVVGTSAADDLITVAPIDGDRALVFNNSPLDVSGPFNAPPEDFATRIPGVSGGSVRPDLDLSGLANLTGLTITDPGPGTGDRLYVYGESSLGLNDGNAFNPFGFGAGQILPAVGQPAAFDIITVSDTQTTVDGHVAVNYNATDFIQADPATQPAVVINAGDEGNPPATPGVDVADDITLVASGTYRFQINGGDPDPVFTGIVPPDGDRLFVSTSGDLSVFSDKAPVPNVTVIDASSNLPFGFSSIETLVLDAQGGTVNLLGDNNFTQDQTDNFVVRGNGPNAFTLEINGSAPIQFVNVTYLNVIGGEDIDTLDIMAWADNTTQGWGIQVFFDEGAPDQTDGGQEDLLIYNTVAANPVSENIVIQPSGPESGELRVTNAVDGSVIVVISYINNLDIIVHDNDGFLSDTDTLTLRGTNPDPGNPNAPSGLEDFFADFSAAGDVANPMVTVVDNASGLLLYRLRNFTNFNSINIEPLGGGDYVEIIGREDGSLKIHVDQGGPTGVGGSVDVDTLAVFGVADADDTFAYFAGATADSGRLEVQRAGAAAATVIEFTGNERLLIDGGGGTGVDTINVSGTSAANQFTVTPTDSLNGSFSVDAFPAIEYSELGGDGAVLNLIGNGLDSARVVGTAGVDIYTYTPTAADAANLLLNDGISTAQFNLSGFGSVLLDAAAGADSLNVTVTNALILPGGTSDSGRVTATTAGGQGLLPLDYQSVESVTVVGGTIVVNGTAGNDVITIDESGLVTVANQGGVVLQSYDLFGATTVIVNGLGGDDTINVIGSVPFAGGLTVIGGEPGEGSDVLNLIGAEGVSEDVEIRPRSSNPLEQEVLGLGGAITVNGIELITYTGDGSDDNLTVRTGNGNDTARLDGGFGFDTLTSSSLPDIRFSGVGDFTLDIFNAIDTATINPTFLGGANDYFVSASVSDTVIFEGAGDSDLWTLTNPVGGASFRLTDNTPFHSGASVTVLGVPENIVLKTLGGDDVVTIDVSVDGPIPLPLTFNGGAGSDTLVIIGTPPAGDFDSVTYSPGPVIDAGRLEYVLGGNPAMRIDFTGLEPVIDATPATTLIVNGTNADNAINYTQGSIPAHGLVSIDGFETIEFTNKTNLVINALAGNDTINLNNPNTPTGLASITVNGGDPTASDQLIVNGTVNADTITYRPTGFDSGVVSVAGLPVVAFSGTEHLTINGLGGGDDLILDTFEIDGTQVLTPGSTFDSGRVDFLDGGFLTNHAVALKFLGLDVGGSLTFSDVDRFDNLIYRGTDLDDTFSVNSAGQVLLNGQIPVNTPSINTLTLAGLAGNDTFNIAGDHNLTEIVVEGGSPAEGDVLNLIGALGVAEDVNIMPNGGNPTEQLIFGLGGLITVSGIELITYTGNGNDDNLTVQTGLANDTARLDGRIFFDELTSRSLPNIRFSGVDEFRLVSDFGLNTATLNPTFLNGANNYFIDSSVSDTVVFEGAGDDDLWTLTNPGGGASLRLTDNSVGHAGAAVTVLGTPQNIVLKTLGGDDVVTIDVSVDGPIPLPLTFNGGAGSDTLVIIGTPPAGDFDSVTYSPGPVIDAGRLEYVLGGNPAMRIDFTGLEPVIDATPATTLIVNGTNADNAINYTQGSIPAHGLVSIDGFETIEFTNKTNLVINALAGNDTINLNNPNTPTGLASITVNGGDPTASDQLIVNGTVNADTITYRPTGFDSGVVSVAGLPVVAFSGTEHLTINGLGGGDDLILDTFEIDGTQVLTPGSTFDSGRVDFLDGGSLTNHAVALKFLGLDVGGSLTFSDVDRFDNLIYRGTDLDDTFSVNSAGQVLLNGQLPVNTPSISTLTLAGLDGNDTFNIAGDHNLTEIVVQGGNPSAGDVLNFVASGAGQVTADFASATVSEAGFGPVSYTGLSRIHLDAGGLGVAFVATDEDDDVTVTVLGASSGAVQIGSTAQQGGQAQQPPTAPLVHYTNTAGNAVDIDLGAGEDTLIVVGNALSQAFVVDGLAQTVTIDDNNNGSNDGIVTYQNAESLAVYGLEGSDTFTVTGGPIPIFIDGGDPIGAIPGDTLILTNAFAFFAGPQNDEGGFLTLGGPEGIVSFDHIESIIVAPEEADDCPFVIFGTNGDDDITVIARDGSTHAGADGVQDFTVSINSGIEMLFLNQPSLVIDALAGDDDIVIRGPAPNQAAWDMQFTIIGGPASSITGDQGDVLAIETPGLVDVVYTPTGSDTGLLAITNTNGVVANITIQNTPYIPGPECPPLPPPLIGGNGGIETLIYDGEGFGDSLTILGTLEADTILHTPGSGIDEGSVRVNTLLAMQYQNLGIGELIIDGDGGDDTLVVDGTGLSDSFTVAANTGAVTLANSHGTRLAIQQLNLEALVLNGLEGDDTFTIEAPQPYDSITVNGGGPGASDVLTISGSVDTDEAFIVNPGFNPGTGSVLVDALSIPFTGVEHVLLRGNGDDNDSLVVNDDLADNVWTVNAGPTFGDRIQIDQRESIDYDGFASVTLVNSFGSDQFIIHPTHLSGTDTLTVIGAGGVRDDVVTLIATEADDVVTSTADTITINGAVPITVGNNGAGFAEVQVLALGGDDHITLSLDLPGVRKFVDGGAGNDFIDMSGTLDAVIFGGDGDDFIIGSPVADFIDGGRGNDIIFGGGGNNIIYGGEGNDILISGTGSDQLFGGAGDDTFIWNPGDGSDLIDGGTGNNRLQFSGGAGADAFVLSANGTRLRLSRQPGNVVMDVANVQQVDTNVSLSFTGLLSGAEEVPPVATAASGRSFLTYNSASNTFDIDLFIQGITPADLVGAHIHVGAAGVNGPVIFNLGTADWYLDGGGLRRRISGATFPEAHIANLLAGNTYVNIHTVTNPGGEIRTQLNPLAAGQGLGGADTFEVFDLHQTDVRVVNLGLGVNNGGLADAAADSVRVHGRTTADHLLITSRPNPAGAAFADLVNVAGLRYDVNLSNAIAADGDRLTVLGNEGDDFIHAVFGVEETILITLDGGAGNDHLIANGTLIGGAGDDLLVGGPGDNLFFGGDGDDVFIGGGGNDTYDGGAGFDTILVNGTPGADTIDVVQSSAVALTYTVNGVTQNETLVAGTVEQVLVEAGAGADLIRVRTADALFNQVGMALRMTVHGGSATGAGDRLIVVDDGTDDLTLYRKDFDETAGTVEIGPANAEPFLIVFSGIERVQFVDENGVAINQDAANGPRLAVFHPDPYEYNDDRLVATYLGSNQTTNLVATIDPGPILNPFGDGQDIPSDQDWYRVVAEVTGTLDFRVFFTQIGTLASGRPGLPGNGNLDIQVIDAAGNVITGFGVNDATDDERRRIPAVAGQTYYLRVFGNGAAINAYNVSVLNAAPPVPFDIELQDTPVGDPPPANSDTGRSQFDNVTRDNTPTIFLRLDDGIFRFDVQGNDPGAGGFPNNPPISTIPIPFQTLAQPGYRIAIFDEGPTPGQPATNPQIPVGFAEAVAGSPGLYRFTFPVALSDGSHFISARVQMIDPSAPQQTGFGARSASLEIIVDTVPPPVHFGLPAVANDGLHPGSDSGVEGNPGTFTDRITNDTTPTFWGTAEANSIIRAYIDVNGNGIVDNQDILIGFTVTLPFDGTNQFPAGRWELTSTVDMNSTQARNLAGGLSPLPEDGLRRILVTAEDLAGNVSAADALNIFIDTQGPQVTNVFITGEPGFNLFLGKFTEPDTIAPTPLVHSLSISVQDLPARITEFLYNALDVNVALNPGHYLLRGDFSGIIPIESVQFISDPLVNGQPASGTIVLNFFEPLPDDRFTLTISDALVDPAGNALDGETNATQPHAIPSFPSGDGQPGGDFSVRFTVDSRPELGVWAAGSVWVDTNGNFTFDPDNADFVNRDITYVMGFTSDHIFAGNFRDAGPDGIAGTADDGAADGFDKLAAYGKVGTQFRWLVDTDNDGVSDPPRGIVDPAAVNGLPVAGNFNPAIPGDQVGLFDGTRWHLDTTGNYNVNEVVTIPGMIGYPIVGDFNGDGLVDLGTWADDTFRISLAGTPGGVGSLGWSTSLISFRFGFIGVRERPVAADMDQDGFTDLGLWVPDRSGVNPSGGGEWYFLISGGESVLDRIVNDAAGAPFIPFTPVPFGNDLYREFGNEFALPIVGNFDPPPGRGESNVVGETPNQFDVDGNGTVEPLDALLVLNFISRHGNGAPAPTSGTPPFPDVNRDGVVTPLDALLVLNYLSQSSTQSLLAGEGESGGRWQTSAAPMPTLPAVEDAEREFELDPSDLESPADTWQADSAWDDLVDTLAESTRSGNRGGLLIGSPTEEEESDYEALVDSALLDFDTSGSAW